MRFSFWLNYDYSSFFHYNFKQAEGKFIEGILNTKFIPNSKVLTKFNQ